MERFRPQIRSNILQLLCRRLTDSATSIRQEEALINLLVMDYFEWIGYCHSEKMLLKESHIDYSSVLYGKENVRNLLESIFNLKSSEESLPVLLVLLSEYKK